jgi:two-component system OmpR family response regulator
MVDLSRSDESPSDHPPATDADVVFEASDLHSLFLKIDDALAILVTRTPLTARQAKDLIQAVREMGGNAIRWGRHPAVEPWTHVAFWLGQEAVTVIIMDRGPGFDHARFSQDALAKEVEELSPRLRDWGFGILLTRGLVDEYFYNERGNQVTLVKRFAHDPDS